MEAPQMEKRPWYKWHELPLVPDFWSRDADEFQSADWCFSWLFLTVWTGMAPNLSVSVEVGHFVGVQLGLPWLHIRLSLPVPRVCRQLSYRYLWRKGVKRGYTKGGITLKHVAEQHGGNK